MFPASEKMTYTWGEDCSIAVTNHNDHIAIIAKTESDSTSYKLLYKGKVDSDIDKIFFDSKMVEKKNSYARYEYGIDEGLAIVVKDGKAALVQNSLIVNSEADLRNAEIECLVVDKTGITYRGKIKSNLVDYGSDMSKEEIAEIEGLLERGIGKKLKKKTIEPIRSENWAEWK